MRERETEGGKESSVDELVGEKLAMVPNTGPIPAQTQTVTERDRHSHRQSGAASARLPIANLVAQVVPNALAALTTSFAAISLGAAFGVLVRCGSLSLSLSLTLPLSLSPRVLSSLAPPRRARCCPLSRRLAHPRLQAERDALKGILSSSLIASFTGGFGGTKVQVRMAFLISLLLMSSAWKSESVSVPVPVPVPVRFGTHRPPVRRRR